MGYQIDQALAKTYQPVPTYDELAREEYINPKKIAPGIKREDTRFVLSPYYRREIYEAVQASSPLDGSKSLQHLGGGLQPLPPPPPQPPLGTGGTTAFGAHKRPHRGRSRIMAGCHLRR